MILQAYSVYDVLSDTYGVPFFSINDDVARRNFSMLCEDTRSIVGLSPRDFFLYHIGSFDDSTSVLTSLPRPNRLCQASDFVIVLPSKGDVSDVENS